MPSRSHHDRSRPAPAARLTRLHWVLISLGGGLALLLLLAWLLVPGIASSIARSKIQSLANEKLMGKVTVRAVSLSWSGPSRVTALELRDDLDRLVATLDADLSIGIFSALGGLSDLGQITLSGQAQVLAKRQPDGSIETNLQRALRPRTPSSDPTKLPAGLRAALAVKDLTIAYKETDAATGQTLAEASIGGLEASATFDGGPVGTGGAKLQATIKAKLRQSPGADGTLALKLALDKLTGADAVLSPAAATVDAQLTIDSLPVRLADALAMQGGLLADLLGDRASVTLTARGSLAGDADFQLAVRSDEPARAVPDQPPPPAGRPRALISGSFALRAGVLSATSPAAVWIDSAAPVARAAALTDRLRDAGVTLTAMPSIDLAIERLSIPLPKAGAPLDLRAAVLMARAGLSPLTGDLRADANTTWRFATEPLTLTVAGDPLAGDVRLGAAGSATLGGLKAGTLDLAMTLGGALDDRGLPRALPARMAGKAELRGVSSEVLSRFASGLSPALKDRLALAQDLGPSLDLSLSAQTDPAAPGTTALTLALTAEHLSAGGRLALSAAELRATEPITAELRSAPALLDRLSAGRSPQADALRVRGSKPLTLRVEQLALPLANGSPDLNAATFRMALAADELTLATQAGGDALSITSARLALARDAGPPSVTLSATASQGGTPITLDGSLRLHGTALGPAVPRAAELPGLGLQRVAGTLNIRGVPLALLDEHLPRGDSGQPGALARAARALAGDTADLTVSLGAPGAEPNLPSPPNPVEQPVAITLVAGPLDAAARIDLRGDHAAASADATLRLTPEQAARVLAILNPGPADSRPALTEATTLRLEVPVTAVPLARSPLGIDRQRLASGGPVVATLAFDKPLSLAATVQGQPTQVMLQGASVRAELPPARLLGGTEGTLDLKAGAAVIASRGGQPLGDAPAELALAAKLAPGGALDASATVSRLSTAAIDTLLADPGLASGALGPVATLTAFARRTAQREPIATTLSLSSQRLTVNSAAVSFGPEGLRLSRTPLEVAWDPDPTWLNDRFLAKPGSPPGALTLADRAPVVLTINTLAVAPAWTATPDRPVGPLAAPTFAVDASVRIDNLALQRGGGRAALPAAAPPQRLTLQGVALSLVSLQSDTPTLRLRASVNNLTDGQRGSGADPVRADLTIRRYADAAGNPSLRSAIIDGSLTTADLPTDLLESLAGAPGSLADHLGPTARVQVTLKDAALGAQPGTAGPTGSADVRVNSPKADLRLAGPVTAGVLRVQPDTPLELSLKDLLVGSEPTASPAAQPGSPAGQPAPRNPFDRLARLGQPAPGGPAGMPATNALGGFIEGVLSPLNMLNLNASRPRSGPPAVVSSRSLAIPLDGDLTKLDGDIDVALGKLDYSFGGDFGPLLAADVLNLPSTDRVAIPAFTVKARRGVLNFDGFQLPLQTGTIKASGSVDLVKRQIDMVAMLPLTVASSGLTGQLTRALGPASQFLPGLAADLTNIPVRVRGPLGQTRPQPDAEAFVKNVGQSLLPKSPEDIGRRLLPNILGEPPRPPAPPKPAPK